MQVQLIGARRVDIVDNKDGKEVHGFTCFISYPSEGVDGLMADRKFIADDFAAKFSWRPEVGKLVNMDFTPQGKLGGLSTVREK